jgi:hypothetical protein
MFSEKEAMVGGKDKHGVAKYPVVSGTLLSRSQLIAVSPVVGVPPSH